MDSNTDLASSETGSYLLGVIHGDGHVSSRSISITVSGKIPEYAAIIEALWYEVGFSPKRYIDKSRNIKIEVHSKRLADEIQKFKSVDRWSFPRYPVSPADYVAGLIDTDGYVSAPHTSRHRVNITQKSGDKLPNIRPILDALGFENIPILRKSKNKIRGEYYPVDMIWWNTQEDVLRLAGIVKLRHAMKSERLSYCVQYIQELRANNKSFHILRFLRENDGATIPEICNAYGFDREDVLRTLNSLRRQRRVTRNDPAIDTLIWGWVDTNKGR